MRPEASAACRVAALARQLWAPAAARSPTLCARSLSAGGESERATGLSGTAAELSAARRQGHAVPTSLRSSGGSAVTYFESNARQLSHAEKARTVLAVSKSGTLSTLHHKTGWPYGSVLNFATEDRPASEGGPRLLTFVSRLAEHTANLLADKRASLLVSAVQGSGDRLATARATFMSEAVQVDKTQGAKKAFLAGHPNAQYVHFDDFLCFELRVQSVRYIGGFGEMSWVAGDAFRSAEPDPIAADAAAAAAAVEHCNTDHANAVLEMAQAFSGLREARKATMLSVDRYGFDVLCETPDGLRRTRVQFPQRLDRGDSLRHVMADTAQRAKEVLAGAVQ